MVSFVKHDAKEKKYRNPQAYKKAVVNQDCAAGFWVELID